MLAIAVLYMKFGDSIFASFGRGPLNILGQRIYGLITDFVLISIPLFIFGEPVRADGHRRGNVCLAEPLAQPHAGGIAVVTCIMAVIMAAMSGIIGGEVVLLGLIALPQMLRLGYDQRLAVAPSAPGLAWRDDPALDRAHHVWAGDRDLGQGAVHGKLPARLHAGGLLCRLHPCDHAAAPDFAPLAEPLPGDPEGGQKFLLFLTFLLTVATGFTVLCCCAVFMFATGQNRLAEGMPGSRLACRTTSRGFWPSSRFAPG